MNLLDMLAFVKKYGQYIQQFMDLYKKYSPVLLQLFSEIVAVLQKSNVVYALPPDQMDQAVKDAASAVAKVLQCKE